MLVPLEKSAANLGLQINHEKNKCKVTIEQGTRGGLQSGDDYYESVDQFKYLGSIITTVNDVSLDINAMHSSWQQSFYRH
jgi:hypothetical protein